MTQNEFGACGAFRVWAPLVSCPFSPDGNSPGLSARLHNSKLAGKIPKQNSEKKVVIKLGTTPYFPSNNSMKVVKNIVPAHLISE